MNAFDIAKTVEGRVMAAVLPFIGGFSLEGRCVVTNKGRLAQILQITVGDILFNDKRGDVVGVEVKGEETEKTGNLFLELWSNYVPFFKPGWMQTLQTDLLVYYFLDTGSLYVASFPRLQRWAFVTPGKKTGHAGRLFDFPEKSQRKYDQRNDTRGRIVPIATLMDEVPMRAWTLKDGIATPKPSQGRLLVAGGG